VSAGLGLRAAAMGAACVTVAAAWPFGSVEPFWFVLAATLVLCLATPLLIRQGWRPDGVVLPRTACAFLVALAVVPLLALIPLPPGLNGLLAPDMTALLADVAPDAAAAWRPVSVDPPSTLRAAVLAAGVAAAAWLALSVASSSAGARPVLWILIAGGVALAAFGLVQRFVAYDPQRIFWSIPLAEVGTPFGPFVNRNHFAGAMVLHAGLAAGAALEAWASGRRWSAILAGAAGALAAVAIVVTTSRGGFLGAAILALVLVAAAHGKGRWRMAVGLAGVTALALGALAASGLLAQWARLFVTDPLKVRWEQRFLVQGDALDIFASQPLMGTGAGTFPIAYGPFQTVADTRHFADAHSDWVQFLMETGVLGAGVIALGVLALVPAVRSAWQGRSAGRWLVLGPVAGVTGLAVHGLFEVNLHVPSNALLAAFALSLAYGATLRPVGSLPSGNLPE
jgi:O-antigen ligase